MADLNNELNVPAAPSLTFDAAPAAPTLTLDPAADEKVIEESKKATPMQVEDTPLSPEEQKMVNDFAEKIDITNSQMVLQYGAASQKKLSDFSDSALSRVRTKDMGETGELITSLISELQGFDAGAEQPKGIFGFFKKTTNSIEQLKTRYDSADKNVERIKAQLEDHQVTLMKDITMLDKMYVEPCLLQGADDVHSGRQKEAGRGPRQRPEGCAGEGPAHPAARGCTGGPRSGRSLRPV